MYILGIETTCDETACAIVKDGFEIKAHVISSQVNIHNEFGGVVPELSSRRHVEAILPVVQKTIESSGISLHDIEAIAVAKGPGLIGSLLVGLNFAKGLAWGLQKPLVGVNHIEAHLYAAIMSHPHDLQFPAIGLVLSGGHTSIVAIHDIGKYQLLAETHDDAIGEAFDKVAKMLGLGYPGGPIIEKLAQQSTESRFHFKAGHIKGKPLDFSFSGIKTKVLYTIRGQNLGDETYSVTEQDKKDISHAFQEAVFSDVVEKTEKALMLFNAKALYIGGGVSQNMRLREMFKERFTIPVYWPKLELCLDNAAMIAGLGYHEWNRSFIDETLTLEPETRIPFIRMDK